MLNRITRVTPMAQHRLAVEFEDGVYGTIDLADRLFGEMFEPLRDEILFGKAKVDKFGAICWPNGADLAPDAIHRTLVRRRFPELARSRPPANATITARDECIDQLIEAIVDVDEHDDVRRAAERLSHVQEWIKREAEPAIGKAEAQDIQRTGRQL